nr:MAG TPA: hypothetical protein [Caudoviricetes sp.]
MHIRIIYFTGTFSRHPNSRCSIISMPSIGSTISNRSIGSSIIVIISYP